MSLIDCADAHHDRPRVNRVVPDMGFTSRVRIHHAIELDWDWRGRHGTHIYNIIPDVIDFVASGGRGSLHKDCYVITIVNHVIVNVDRTRAARNRINGFDAVRMRICAQGRINWADDVIVNDSIGVQQATVCDIRDDVVVAAGNRVGGIPAIEQFEDYSKTTNGDPGCMLATYFKKDNTSYTIELFSSYCDTTKKMHDNYDQMLHSLHFIN